MEQNFYYQIQDKMSPNRSALLTFAATDLDLYQKEIFTLLLINLGRRKFQTNTIFTRRHCIT